MAKPILKNSTQEPRKKKNVGFHENEHVKVFNKDSPVNREIDEPLAHTPTKHVPVVTTDEKLHAEHRDRVLNGNSQLDEPLIQLKRSVTMHRMPIPVMELKKEPIHVEPKRGFFYRLYDRVMGTMAKKPSKGGRKTRKLRGTKRRN